MADFPAGLGPLLPIPAFQVAAPGFGALPFPPLLPPAERPGSQAIHHRAINQCVSSATGTPTSAVFSRATAPRPYPFPNHRP